MKQMILATVIMLTVACAPAVLGGRIDLQMEMIRNSGLQVDQFMPHGDTHGDHYLRLKKWLVEVKETPVEEIVDLDETYSVLGYTQCLGPSVCAIAVDGDMPANSKYSTLLHEATHSFMLTNSRAVNEILAETVAWEAARLTGLNTTRESMSYLMQFDERTRRLTYEHFEPLIKQWVEELVKVSKGEG